MSVHAENIGQTISGRTKRNKAVFAAIVGNMMEYYDFAVYAYFAAIIGGVFFPNSSYSLLLSFAAFGVGFISRPLGGYVFGIIGDKLGRRTALTISVLLMAISTCLIGLLPTPGQIGILATILLVILRLIQGFSVGGEYAGSAVYIVEYAEPRRRGLYGSIQSVSIFLALVLGSGIAAFISYVLPHEDVVSYGWRIPFLAGLILGIVGLYLRLALPDTPEFDQARDEKELSTNPLIEAIQTKKGSLIQILGISTLITIPFFIVSAYLPTYMSEEAGVPASDALLITVIAMIWACFLNPFFGWLSDMIGRKPIAIASGLLCIVGAYPLFLIMSYGTAWAVVGMFGMMIPLSMILGIGPTLLSELLPTNLRYSGFSVCYNIAIAIFGGFAPFIATFLVDTTGDPLSPAYYLAFSGVVGVVAGLSIRVNENKYFRNVS